MLRTHIPGWWWRPLACPSWRQGSAQRNAGWRGKTPQRESWWHRAQSADGGSASPTTTAQERTIRAGPGRRQKTGENNKYFLYLIMSLDSNKLERCYILFPEVRQSHQRRKFFVFTKHLYGTCTLTYWAHHLQTMEGEKVTARTGIQTHNLLIPGQPLVQNGPLTDWVIGKTWGMIWHSSDCRHYFAKPTFMSLSTAPTIQSLRLFSPILLALLPTPRRARSGVHACGTYFSPAEWVSSRGQSCSCRPCRCETRWQGRRCRCCGARRWSCSLAPWGCGHRSPEWVSCCHPAQSSDSQSKWRPLGRPEPARCVHLWAQSTIPSVKSLANSHNNNINVIIISIRGLAFHPSKIFHQLPQSTEEQKVAKAVQFR